MMSEAWYRGETFDYRLLVVLNGIEQDLAPAEDIVLSLRADPGQAALATLRFGSGISLNSGGMSATITAPSNWLTALTGPAWTIPAGNYYVDVALLFPNSVRRIVVKPFRVALRDAGA